MYFKTCDFCSYTSIKSTDPVAYTGMVADVADHIARHHSGKRQEGTNEAAHAYAEATKTVEVPAGLDNRSSIIHVARTYPGILDPFEGARATPLEQEGVYCHPDMWHVGIRLVDPRPIRLLHNRANTSLKLQQLSPHNLATKSDELKKFVTINAGTFVEGESFDNFKNIGECVLSFNNYAYLSKWIHPMDYGPYAIFHLILEKYVNGLIPSVKTLLGFFKVVQSDNANRALRQQLPLTYEELLPKWEQSAGSNSSGGFAELLASYQKLLNEFKDFKAKHGLGQASDSQGPSQGAKGSANKKRKMSGNAGYCMKFNTPEGCNNQASGAGCTFNGKEYRHGCKFMVNGRYCNRKDHSMQNHV